MQIDKRQISKRKSFIKGLFLFFIFMMVLGILIGLKLFWGVIRPVEVDDKDLMVQLSQVPDQDNGYAFIRNLPPVIYEAGVKEKSQKWMRGEEWDQAAVSRFLSQNEKSLHGVKAVLSKKYFQNTNIPLWSDPAGKKDVFSIMKLMEIRTRALKKTGDNADLYAALADQMLLSNRIISAQCPLFEYMSGLAGRLWTLETISDLLKSENISSDDITYFGEVVKDPPNILGGFVAALKMEYMTAKLSLPSLHSWWGYRYEKNFRNFVFDLFGMSHYDRPDTVKMYYDIHKEIIRHTTYPISKETFSVETLLKTEIEKQEKHRGNFIGVLLLRIGIPGHSKALYNCAKCDTLSGCVQVQIAIRRYFHENGAVPRTLDELIPKYLKKIPEDYFSSGPLKYSSQLACVFSVKSEDYHEESEWIKKESPAYIFLLEE